MNGGDYHAPKHIFGHASQEMSQAVSTEAPAGEAAGDETMPLQHLSALDEADCLNALSVTMCCLEQHPVLPTHVWRCPMLYQHNPALGRVNAVCIIYHNWFVRMFAQVPI